MNLRQQEFTDQGIARREAILAAMRAFTAKNGYPPSVREIAELVGLSSSGSVQRHLRLLAKDGLIGAPPPGSHRAYYVLP